MSNPRIIEPMKINRIPDGKENLFPSICASGEYFAELKKDGYWYIWQSIVCIRTTTKSLPATVSTTPTRWLASCWTWTTWLPTWQATTLPTRRV